MPQTDTINRRWLLAERPKGEPTAETLRPGREPAAGARRRPDPAAHPLPLARPLHARADERRAVLRAAGRRSASVMVGGTVARGRGEPHPASRRATGCWLKAGSARIVGGAGRASSSSRQHSPWPWVPSGCPASPPGWGFEHIGAAESRRDPRRRGGDRAGRLDGRPARQARRGAASSASRAVRTSAASPSRSSASTPASTTAPPTSPSSSPRPCPDGIDVYFENVGGKVLEAVMPLLNADARIPLCGLVAHYNATSLPGGTGPDAPAARPHARQEDPLAGLHHRRPLRQSLPGIRRAKWAPGCEGRDQVPRGHRRRARERPGAFIGMLKGKNFGKRVIHVGQP